MVPRLKPTLVCPGPLLLTPAVTPAAEAGTTTSLAFPVHTGTHTCYLTLSPVFLPVFDLPLRIRYNFPSCRKSSLMPLQTVLHPSASRSSFSCLRWWVISFFDELPSSEKAGSILCSFLRIQPLVCYNLQNTLKFTLSVCL